MSDSQHIENLFRDHGCDDFKWITPDRIVVSQWVRIKCQFGCPGYGKSLSCPPHVPSVPDCKQFFSEYQEAVLFRFRKSVTKPEDRLPWSKEVNERLLAIERAVFLAGFHKAFALLINECRLCTSCAGVPDKCKFPKQVRPMPESMAIDLFETVRSSGYPIEVLKDYSDEMNRYALLMVK